MEMSKSPGIIELRSAFNIIWTEELKIFSYLHKCLQLTAY
jgi:hypothetical protein